MKFQITACIENLFNSFTYSVYGCIFFRVMQQQTIGEVANSITRL